MWCHLPDADVKTLRNGPTAACVNGIARTMPRGPLDLTKCLRCRILRLPPNLGVSCLIFGLKKWMLKRQAVYVLGSLGRLTKFPAQKFALQREIMRFRFQGVVFLL